MKPLSVQLRRRLTRFSGWAGFFVFVLAVYLVYRQAEPSPASFQAAQTSTGGGVTIRLDNTPFAGYINGARTWSLYAGQVNIERQANSSLSTIQNATLTDIKDGIIYEPPQSSAPQVTSATPVSHTMETGSAASQGEKPIATFRAKQGRYSLGSFETIPIEIDMAYAVQWEFKLTGNVLFRTQAGDELTAPSLTFYNLISKRHGKIEQRVVCDDSAKMTHKGIQVTANRLRFNPKDRTVECLNGVRGTFKEGAVQVERAFWSLNDETLRCPESATGIMDNSPFTAESLTLDMKRLVHHASHIHIEPTVSNSSDTLPIGRTVPLSGPGVKRANLDLFDAAVNERTGVTSGRDFTFSIPEDRMTVTGSTAQYNKNTSVLESQGNLVMDDPTHHVTGETARVDNSKKAKLAILSGNILLLLKPKNSPQRGGDVNKETSKGATVSCDRIEDHYERQFVILGGHLIFKQKIIRGDGSTLERSLTAEHAEYDGKTGKLHLFAPVDLKDTENQSGHFDQDVFVGTKEGKESIQSKGHFIGIFNQDNTKTNEQPDEESQPPAASESPLPGSAGRPVEPPKSR